MRINKTKKGWIHRLSSGFLAIIFAFTLVLSAFPIYGFADTAISYIGVSSDIHGSVSNVSAWLASNGDSLKYMVFGGDNADSWSSSNITAVKNVFSTSYPSTTPVFTMGNHDWSQGSAKAFEDATENARTGIKNNPDAEDYTIYTFGAASATYEFSTQNSDIADLTAALEAADKTEPFFIISHYPLHLGEGMDARKTGNASTIITLLNKYPNVVFFWGHNHHSPDSTMNTIKVAGDSIVAADTNSSVTINFTYCNSGHMGSGNNSATTDGTGVRVKIADYGSTSQVDLSIDEKDGTVLTEKTVDIGSSTPSSVIGSVSITDITAPVGGAAPDTNAVVSPSGVMSTVTWYSGNTVFTGTAFAQGATYTAQVTLTPPESKVFSSSPSAKINGNEAAVVSGSDSLLIVSYTFPAAPDSSLTYCKATSLTDGHQYAVVMGGAAMNTTAQSGSTSQYSYTGLGYTNAAISSDKNALTFASADKAAAATWTFTSAGPDSQWYISNQGSYLYAQKSRALELAESGSKTAWTCGVLNSNSQLYATLYDDATSANATCKLFYGSTSTVNFFYPSVNNDGNLTIYEKPSATQLPAVDHIAITNPPSNITYTAGESFDPVGLQVTVYYTDSTSTAVTGYTINPSGPLSVGTTYVTVTYQEKTAVQPITVNSAMLYVYKKVTSITSGAEYAVVLDGKAAMSNAGATGTANGNTYTGLSYVTPTINGDYLIFSSVDDASAATWKLTADGSGWDIQNGTQYVNATASRTMALGTAQAWTYGTLSSKGTQLYVSLSSTNYNLCYGGSTTVNFIYPSSNTYNTLTLYEKQPLMISGITVTTPPAKTAYSVGEGFDSTGMVVTAMFSNGLTADVTGYTTLPSAALALTDSQVAVSFLGKTASTPINVFPAGSTTYSLSSTIEPGAKYVIVSNKSGTAKALQNSVASTNYLASPTVTVSGDEVTSSVSKDMLWTAETGSTGMLFQNGGKYLTRGAQISGSSTNYGLAAGSMPSSTLGDWIYPSDNHLYVTSGGTNYYLYISSGNYFRVNTTAQTGESFYLYKQTTTTVILDSIEVTGAKTSYNAGQAFDPTGMVVTAHFSDGTNNNVLNYTYTPSGPLSDGDTTITVSYCNKEAPLSVAVASVTLKSISAVFTQGATAVYPSTSLESLKNMLVVTGTNNDNSTFTIPAADYTLSGTLAAPSSTVTVTYSGKTTTFNVTVTPVTLKSIAVTTSPNKTAYVEGDVFQPSGMAVTAYYNDDSSALLGAADYTYSPSGRLSVSDRAITISYSGKTASITISVSSGGGSGGGISVPTVGGSATIVITLPVFTDVPETSWFYSSVQYVVNAGIFKGTSNKVFDPSTPISRAMFISILSRIEFGSDDSISAGSTAFIDLTQDWYKSAVAWGVRNGIVQGISSVKFSPDDKITREQIAVLLYNYAKYKNYDISYNESRLGGFTDANNISAYARTAMMWAVSKGLICGVTADYLEPQGSATRAQAAAIIQRFNELIA